MLCVSRTLESLFWCWASLMVLLMQRLDGDVINSIECPIDTMTDTFTFLSIHKNTCSRWHHQHRRCRDQVLLPVWHPICGTIWYANNTIKIYWLRGYQWWRLHGKLGILRCEDLSETLYAIQCKHLFITSLVQIAAITTTKSILRQHLSSCYLWLADLDRKEDAPDGKDVRVAKQEKRYHQSQKINR